MTTPAYAEVSDIKALMPNNTFPPTLDAALTQMIADASREIDTYLGREPGAFKAETNSTRYFNGSGSPELWLFGMELAALPSMVEMATSNQVANAAGSGGSYVTLSADDYLPFPQNALAQGNPILRLDMNITIGSYSIWYPFKRGVRITGKFGFSTTVPSEIAKATKIQAYRYYKQAAQGFVDLSTIPELGQLMYTKALHPEVQAILNTAKFNAGHL